MTAPRTEAVAAAYAALHDAVVVGDRSARRRLTLEGDRCAEVLTGLVTNDVLALRPGEGQFAMALTPKGKVVADLRIFRREDGILCDTGPRAGDGAWELLRKYVNPRLARYADVTASQAEVGVFGPHAADLVAEIGGVSPDLLRELPVYAHRTGPGGITIAHVPDYGVPGYSLFVPGTRRDALIDSFLARGARLAPIEALECARIEAGRPEWGLDIDDSTLAHEANIEELGGVSFSKGCYTGQETVARLHFRGHVNRLLRALRFDVRDAEVVVSRAALLGGEGTPVGDIRSVAQSPRHGGVGIGMVRREVPPGSILTTDPREAGARVELRVLAFPYQTA